jgi:cytochrome c-type biogenesis protein
MDISIAAAFLGGLASFLSPCVFSLVPAYIGYLSGRSLALSGEEPVSINPQNRGATRYRLETFSHGLAFVLGFSLVFITLGVAASALGGLIADLGYVVARIGGLMVIIFGVHMTGLVRIPFLEYDLRPQTRLDQRRSYLTSALIGVFFSAGWMPCTGPVLASIYAIAINEQSVSLGLQLLTAYSAGLAIPFLAAALCLGWVTFILRRFRKFSHWVEVATGVVLIIVGVMLVLGSLPTLARFFQFLPNLG